MSNASAVHAVHAACVGEVAWTSASGRPDVAAVTPLVLDDAPAIALPYAYGDLARAMGAADRVAFIVSDPRLSGSAWRPVAVLGRPRLIEDRDGALFTERLLPQELRKFPPSRALADSPILQREHWWYLPRLVVVVEPDAVMEVGRREGGAGDGVLAVSGGRSDGRADRPSAHLDVAVVTVAERRGRIVELDVHGDHLDGPAGIDGADAALLCHDFSTPDLERWVSWTASGRVAGLGRVRFEVEHETGDVVLPEPLGLMARIRRHRDLAGACRRAL